MLKVTSPLSSKCCLNTGFCISFLLLVWTNTRAYLGDLDLHLISIPQNTSNTCANIEVIIVSWHSIQEKGLDPKLWTLNPHQSLSVFVYISTPIINLYAFLSLRGFTQCLLPSDCRVLCQHRVLGFDHSYAPVKELTLANGAASFWAKPSPSTGQLPAGLLLAFLCKVGGPVDVAELISTFPRKNTQRIGILMASFQRSGL